MKIQKVTDKLLNECELYILNELDIIQANTIKVRYFKNWIYHIYKFIKKAKVRIQLNKQKTVEQTVHGVVQEFFKILMDEIIDNNSIFVFPKNKMVIAIAQRESNSIRYKYNIKNQSGSVACYIIIQPKYFNRIKKKYIMIVSRRMWKRIQVNIENGMKYITYEQLIEQLDFNVKGQKRKK